MPNLERAFNLNTDANCLYVSNGGELRIECNVALFSSSFGIVLVGVKPARTHLGRRGTRSNLLRLDVIEFQTIQALRDKSMLRLPARGNEGVDLRHDALNGHRLDILQANRFPSNTSTDQVAPAPGS